MKKSINVTYRESADIVSLLDEFCSLSGTSRSSILRLALRKLLNDKMKTDGQPEVTRESAEDGHSPSKDPEREPRI